MTRRPVVAGGVGVTAFLAVAGGVTGALASIISFSALVGLPVGLLAGVGAALGAGWALRRSPTPLAVRTLVGLAAFGYAVLSLAGLRYAVAGTRELLRGPTVLGVAAVVAFAAAALAPRLRLGRPP